MFSYKTVDVCLQVDREYRVQKALFSAGFPVPQPLLHCTDTDVIGTEFYLMEHVRVSLARVKSLQLDLIIVVLLELYFIFKWKKMTPLCLPTDTHRMLGIPN